MPIVVRLDQVLANRKMRVKDLAESIGITDVNVSNIKTGRIKAIRFSTLGAICHVLKCQPGDLLEYIDDLEESDIELLDDENPV